MLKLLRAGRGRGSIGQISMCSIRLRPGARRSSAASMSATMRAAPMVRPHARAVVALRSRPPPVFRRGPARRLRTQAGAAGGSSAELQALLGAIEGTERGLRGSGSKEAEVLQLVEALAASSASSRVTTAAADLSATWKLLWTTEKETLFILEKAPVFGTEAGDVFQVIDVDKGLLQNVITFPPDGAFIVTSGVSVAGDQRMDFKFNAAKLKLPKRDVPFPPFGQGWFESVYLDDRIRVAKDIRGDTLIVARDGPPRLFA